MKRLFLAVDLPFKLRQDVAEAVAWMGECRGRVKVVPPENFHVTVKFLGATAQDKVAKVQAALSRVADTGPGPGEFSLGGWGVFPEKGHPLVFWIGVEPAEALKPLFDRCEAAVEPLGFARETRSFRAHLTLARAGEHHAPAEFLHRWRAMPPLACPAVFRAEKLVLYESTPGPEAPVYRPLVRFDL